jgi:hypothetical protein
MPYFKRAQLQANELSAAISMKRKTSFFYKLPFLSSYLEKRYWHLCILHFSSIKTSIPYFMYVEVENTQGLRLGGSELLGLRKY